MQSHTHQERVSVQGGSTGVGIDGTPGRTGVQNSYVTTASYGGGDSQNLQPFTTVNILVKY